jgi:GNAT superfamily N-acetyltransferase
MTESLQDFDTTSAEHRDALVAIWNAACGPALSVTPRLFDYNMRPTAGVARAGCLAVRSGRPRGFVMASAAEDSAWGWVDAIAVAPNARRQGIGGALLGWAERWLARRGCTGARLGGSPRPFAPGLPVELGTEPFFAARGYGRDREVWDVARDLRDYAPPATALVEGVRVEPVRAGQEDALLEFMRRSFPGRWAWKCEGYLREGGPASDYLALWADERIAGFCQVTFEDSPRPIDRFFMRGLPRPWGQIGPLGVGAESRGKGYGAAVIDGGLRFLRDRGARGCVIDWTDLLGLYGKFGFAPHRRYAILMKELPCDGDERAGRSPAS